MPIAPDSRLKQLHPPVRQVHKEQQVAVPKCQGVFTDKHSYRTWKQTKCLLAFEIRHGKPKFVMVLFVRQTRLIPTAGTCTTCYSKASKKRKATLHYQDAHPASFSGVDLRLNLSTQVIFKQQLALGLPSSEYFQKRFSLLNVKSRMPLLD